MRVLIVTPTFPMTVERVHDSIQRYAYALVRSLAESGTDIAVATTASASPQVSTDLPSVEVVRLWDSSLPFGKIGKIGDLHYVTFSRSVARWLETQNSFDVIHTLCQLIGFRNFRRRSKVLVSSFHHLETYYRWSDLLHLPFAFRLAAQTFADSDAIVCSSDAAKNQLLHSFDELAPEKIHTIQHGVDPKEFTPPSDTQLRRQPSRVLYVGSITERKGLDQLCHATKLLLQKGIQVEVDIIGTGPFSRGLRSLVDRLGIEGFVRIRGAVSETELVRLYQTSGMFVLPTRLEGFGISLLEAMSCGLPVISTDISPVRELVGDAGVLLRNLSPQVLAEAIEDLMGDPISRAAFSRAGRLKVAEHYTWDAAAHQTLQIYRQLSDQKVLGSFVH